jgi:hypothetical protein
MTPMTFYVIENVKCESNGEHITKEKKNGYQEDGFI